MLPGHPACPRLIDHGDDWMTLEPCGAPVEDPLAQVLSWPEGRIEQTEGCLGAWLRAMPGVVDPARALRKLGLKRAAKLLDRPLQRSWERGPSLGGVHGGWLRRASEGRVVALRWSRASAWGWPAMDRAATAWFAGEAVPEEWDLELLRVLLDEAVLGRDPRAAEEALACVERLVPRGEPERVEIRVEAPDWLDVSAWNGPQSASMARKLLRLEGCVSMRVRSDPPLRAGERPQPREPRALRLQRLFSRWHQGVRCDEEGLFSLTPEAIALDMAADCSGRVLDATCGVGGLAIALARRGCSVLAVDSSPERVAMARHNAALYGVDVEFRVADARSIRGHFDHVVVDPPWGGVEYSAGLGIEDLPLARDLLRGGALFHSKKMHLKLPVSFDMSTLPGATARLLLDHRGVPKLLWVRC